MNCPIDNTELAITERSGIEIDYCPKCRGIWLDRGELDKIIERSNQTIDEARREYRGDTSKYDDDYYRKRKKKSFLGDLFDF